MNRPLGPGSTIGIIGGGQLGTMIARQAHRMGYRVAVVDPAPECPAAARADRFLPGRYDDVAALAALARASDVVTIETEHVPAPGLHQIEALAPVRPRPEVLATVQDRLAQREFLARGGFPQTRFAPVGTRAELEEAVAAVGVPGILKLRHGGYDGKGQARVPKHGAAPAAWERLGCGPAVLEAFVDFDKELSIVIARGPDGDTVAYPLAENVHRNGILHTTRVPARAGPDVEERARAIATRIAAGMEHVGVMTIELFLTGNGDLLVNEIAPRIHNSGHYTEGPCSIAQGEQHLRAITGHTLVPPTLYRPVVMLNILGDAWADGEPDWEPILREPRAQLHLYGKKDPRPGRKMGHVLVAAAEPDEAERVAHALHRRLLPAARVPSPGP